MRGRRAPRPNRVVLVAVAVASALAAAVPAAAQAPPGIDVAPGRLPPAETAEIAQHGSHITWQETMVDAAGRQVVVVLDRSAGRTVALPIAPVRDLDLGPGADGGTVAVYARCAPSCDIWRYDYARRREQRVASVSAPGVSERLPTIWGSRIAFARGGSVILRDLGARRSQTIARRVFPDDLELGARHLAYVGLFERGEGNGTMEVRIRGLASRREQVLGSGVIGEGASTGFGALTFEGTRLSWQVRRRHGCRLFTPSFARYDIRRGGRARATPRAEAPPAVRRRAIVPPETPESDAC